MKGRYSLVSQIISDAMQGARFFCSKSCCPASDGVAAKTAPGAQGPSAERHSGGLDRFIPQRNHSGGTDLAFLQPGNVKKPIRKICLVSGI